MTANTSPIFGLTPNTGLARVTAANTASDGSGSLVTLFTAGSNGSMVFRVRYTNSQATAAASSAMVMRVFQTDTGGANPRLILEIAIPTATRSTTAIGASGIFNFPNGGLTVSSGAILKVIQSVYAGAQDQMDYVAEGIDY